MKAVEPSQLLSSARTLRTPHNEPVFLIAAGKAAWPMAGAFLQVSGLVPRRGMVAGPRVGESPASSLEWFDAGHPFPNQASVDAAERALALARTSADEGGILVVLLSGGASAMLTAPADGITLADKVATARAVMNAGFAIGELNCVRKHLSRIKGGQLAAAARRTHTLAISDVHGPVPDDPSVIGSGPTVADPTTFAEAVRIASRVPDLPAGVLAHLARGASGDATETVKPGDPRLVSIAYEVIGNRATALAGARRAAEALGYDVVVIEKATAGEAREASTSFLDAARHAAATRPGGFCLLAAGETTVTVRGQGRGGRNQEFALAAAPELTSFDGEVVVGSVGTDGADGPTDAAGAIVDRTTIERSVRAGLDWRASLASNDAYHFLGPLGDLVRWGPTGTNVGDVQLFLRA